MRGTHPVIELILEYRQLVKLKSTYVDALPHMLNAETGRLHTSFNQTGTVTGRLSSSDPNLQNIPIRTELGRKVRRAFIAGNNDSVLLSADYSQIDLRILAHISKDPHMIEAFRNGEDIHAATASQIFAVPIAEVTSDMRRVAKTINFGVIYGVSDFGLSSRTGMGRREAGEFIQKYLDRYACVRDYMDQTKRQAEEKGYVETLLGRRRSIPEIKVQLRSAREAAFRTAINAPIQGTAADIIKIAMIRLDNELQVEKRRTKMIVQVHDELVFEVPRDELEDIAPLVKREMEGAMALDVPVLVDMKTGRNWAEME
jgi:DNA polymerase-1